MSSLQACLLLFAWLLLVIHPVCSVALNLPVNYSEDASISNSVVLQEQPPTSSVPTPTTPSPPQNCTQNKTSTSRSFSEQKETVVNSIRQQILAKLNLNELPQSVPATSDLPPSLLADYYANLQALRQNADEPHECQVGETTHFARHLRLYYPDSYVPVNSPPGQFQVELMSEIGEDGKGKEIKATGKTSSANSPPNSAGKSSPISPFLYSLRFDTLDFSDNNRIWSVQLQLYKRKAPSVPDHYRRGMNPVENVKIYRVVRRFERGRWTKSYVLFASKNIPSVDEGLVSFNITSGVKNWLERDPQETSLELDVHIDTPERVDTGQVYPPVIVFDIPFYPRGTHDARLLVERLNEKERLGQGRHKRQTVKGVNSKYCFNNPNETNCCIKELSVDFHSDLGWDWILYPTSFKPNYCKGQCQNPLWAHATQSTSLLMQLRASNPTAAAEPCCVAHRTRSLTVLMVHNDGNIILNEIPDMIVDSCICR